MHILLPCQNKKNHSLIPVKKFIPSQIHVYLYLLKMKKEKKKLAK